MKLCLSVAVSATPTVAELDTSIRAVSAFGARRAGGIEPCAVIPSERLDRLARVRVNLPIGVAVSKTVSRLASVQIPKNRRGSKHDFSAEEVDQALQMLEAGEHPGGGPYAKLSEARRAGIRLTEQLEHFHPDNATARDVGVRSWEGQDGFYFGLRIGKRKRSK